MTFLYIFAVYRNKAPVNYLAQENYPARVPIHPGVKHTSEVGLRVSVGCLGDVTSAGCSWPSSVLRLR